MNVEHLQLESLKWRITPSESLVRGYEEEFSLELPADYREFLSAHGGAFLDASCLFKEPTPVGDRVLVNKFYGFMPPEHETCDVRWNTDLIDGAPDIVAVADNFMGGMLWLTCTGPEAGYVYYHDHEKRSTWPDAFFYERFSNIHPTIERYLTLRRTGALPVKRRGYDNVYLVARSFKELIESLSRVVHDEAA